MIKDRALISDSMVIPGSSGSLQMVDHTLIDVPLANASPDSAYYKGPFKKMCVSSTEKSNREETKNRDSKKKPPQLKKNDNSATQDVKVQESAKEGKCDAGQVFRSAQAKKSDKIHPLKVKEAMSSVNMSTIADLEKYSTLKICFDRVGKQIIRTMLESSSCRMDYFIKKTKR